MSSEGAAPLRSLAWARATGGALTDEQRRQLRAAIRHGYLDFARGLVRLPFGRRAVVEMPAAPDSRLAREAEEAAKEQGAGLAGHGYRTWLLGATLAEVDGVDVDPELFYVASLLHDAGIVTAVTGEDFTIRSADAVLAVTRAAGREVEAEGMRMADAVVAHATPGLRVEDEPLGFYVQAGALADLAALRLWDLPRGAARRAYEEFPGCGVHSELPALIAREADAVPEGRFALLHKAGMHRTIQLSLNRRLA